MQIITWGLRAFLFLLLVVLALQNTHEAVVRLYFGTEWRAPMMLVVLAAFAFGALCGILAMLPWRVKRRAAAAKPAPGKTVAVTAANVAEPADAAKPTLTP